MYVLEKFTYILEILPMVHLKYLLSILSMKNSISASGFETFLKICVSALDNFAPRKNSRGRNIPFMSQTLK